MTRPWPQLQFWNSGECQVCMEALDEVSAKGLSYTPARKDLFKALSTTHFDDVRVCILGQDPYPNPLHATGIAFSIPEKETHFPPTLSTILNEYHNDLGYPVPKSGSLLKWANQGVLLWNAYPVCVQGRPMSCPTLDEWLYLTKEIISELNERAIVFGALGRVARELLASVIKADDTRSKIVEVGHPSPRGNLNSRSPFSGSRFFSTINQKLNEQGLATIDWKLT